MQVPSLARHALTAASARREAAAGRAAHGILGRVLTSRGFVAGEGDVQLAVVGQAKGAADGLRELAVALGAGLDLRAAAQAWACPQQPSQTPPCRECSTGQGQGRCRTGRAQGERGKRGRLRLGVCATPGSGRRGQRGQAGSCSTQPHLEAVRAAVKVDVHDGRSVGSALRRERLLPVGQPRVAKLAVRLLSANGITRSYAA